jgi:hypothetical protein
MLWFGDPWPSPAERAPVCSAEEEHVPVPVGQHCGMCAEPVITSDRGVWMEHLHTTGTADQRPVHLRCLIRSVFPDAAVP